MATKSPADLRWIRPPQQARSQETLERILDATETLVVEKGFEDTPISEIVRRAGSSVGAFYTRFEDKDALLHALYQRYYEEALATADDALDPARWQGRGVAVIVASITRFLVSVYRDHGPLIRAFIIRTHLDAGFQARQERLYLDVTTRLSALLLARRGEITHPQPERAIAFGLALVFSGLERALIFGDTRPGPFVLDDDDVAAELTRSYLAYLGTPA
jgi:AcrR family transcriptional regulator